MYLGGKANHHMFSFDTNIPSDWLDTIFGHMIKMSVMFIQKVLSSNKYKIVIPIILILMDNICSPASNSV